MSRMTRSGRAVESTTMAFKPPVSAISRVPGTQCPAIVAWMRRAVAVDPVKATPPRRLSPVSAEADFPRPGRAQLQRRSWNPGLKKPLRAPTWRSHWWSPPVWRHRIACRKRHRDLAGENRQPGNSRTDAGDHTARRQLGHRPGLNRVIPKEIHRLAQFCDRVGQCFPASTAKIAKACP